jgi:hypothetical protein
MAERDVVRDLLTADPNAVVRIRLDEYSHIEGIDLIAGSGRIVGRISHKSVVEALVREGALLAAPRLTPERWYVHAQPWHDPRLMRVPA